MRVLTDVKPTSEQLTILTDYRPGFVLIRGAAGSGKTTTAVLRLRFVTGVWRRERKRGQSSDPVNALVLTYNRTLRGYVEALVEQQIGTGDIDLTLSTFGKWAWERLGRPSMLSQARRASKVWELASGLGYGRDFIVDEVDYILGRYQPAKLDNYANPRVRDTYERRGRGASPRVDRGQRERILEEVIRPYQQWKLENGELDWSDLAVRMTEADPEKRYDIALIDEAQDFSANEVRAIKAHLARTHSTTFVLDAVQQIYPRGFTWREAGIDIVHSYRLKTNHRNTKQIAAFARPLVADLPVDDDGTLPDFDSTEAEGPLPLVVRGEFSKQMDWVIEILTQLPADESAALLHPRGGSWFAYTRQRLDGNGIAYVNITRQSEWPRGAEQVGLSTLHSAKGLEFDHVIVLGLNAELMPHGAEESDTQLATHRRLVAMAIGRARLTAAVTYKPSEASKVVEYLDPDTFEAVDLQ